MAHTGDSTLIRLAHFGDTHLLLQEKGSFDPRAVPKLEILIESLLALRGSFDVAIHIGDVTQDATTAAEYQFIFDRLRQIEVPVLFIPGNHDDRKVMEKFLYLNLERVSRFDAESCSYETEINGFQIIALDLAPSAMVRWGGKATAAQLEHLQSRLSAPGPTTIIAVHYPLFPIDFPATSGMVEVENAAELHQVIASSRRRIAAVLHGHAHQSLQYVRDGVLYVGVGSIAAAIPSFSNRTEAVTDFESAPTYNLITVDQSATLVKQVVLSLTP